jgi:group I intron endonuclease
MPQVPITPSGLIYVAENLANGKLYVGQTASSLARRRQSHFQNARKSFHACRAFYSAIRKYGEGAFEFSTLVENVPVSELDNLESLWIIALGSMVGENGYNLKISGQAARLSQETRNRISVSLKGRKLSAEAIAKRTEKLRGRKWTQAERDSRWAAVLERRAIKASIPKPPKKKKKRGPSTQQGLDSLRKRMMGNKIGLNASPETRKLLSAAANKRWRKHREGVS